MIFCIVLRLLCWGAKQSYGVMLHPTAIGLLRLPKDRLEDKLLRINENRVVSSVHYPLKDCNPFSFPQPCCMPAKKGAIFCTVLKPISTSLHTANVQVANIGKGWRLTVCHTRIWLRYIEAPSGYVWHCRLNINDNICTVLQVTRKTVENLISSDVGWGLTDLQVPDLMLP